MQQFLFAIYTNFLAVSGATLPIFLFICDVGDVASVPSRRGAPSHVIARRMTCVVIVPKQSRRGNLSIMFLVSVYEIAASPGYAN